MANEERFTTPNIQHPPDRADEVQRRTEVTPPGPPKGGEASANEPRTPASSDMRESAVQADAALFPSADITRLRNQWSEIQAAFVDEPRSAVQRADALVGDVLKSLSDTFARERSRLESQWDHDGDVTTEDFRVALRRYREFFDRLLSI